MQILYQQEDTNLNITRFPFMICPLHFDRTNSIVLNICQRVAQTRTYTPMEEVTWEASKAGNPESLKQVIADRMLIPVERVAMAKHLTEKFEWLVINCTPQVRVE